MKIRTKTPAHALQEQRRRFLRLAGTAAALLPITTIMGCSDGSAPPPASSAREPAAEPQAQQSAPPEPQPEPAAPEPMENAAEPATGDLPQVSLDNPTAKALGYEHDAANIDAAKYPQRGPNQVCRNCTLYQGSGSAEWGPCQLFPGKAVNANGWCSGYTPKPS